jgi:hypothetical protein
MTSKKHGTHRSALERTIDSDPVFADEVHSGLLALARALADQLDGQGDKPESRVIATYSGQLHSLGRVARDARVERQKAATAPARSASRLALIKSQAESARKEAS